jgi:hypothetical protein
VISKQKETRLIKYYEQKSNRRPLKTYLEEMDELAYINVELPVPEEVTGPCQVLEPFNDGYLLRIFQHLTWWEGYTTKSELLEEFRCYFGKTYGDSQLVISRQYGYSGVYGFRYPRKMQGYHQADLAYNTPLPFYNKTDLFPYIEFRGLKLVGMHLMEQFYAADQKQHHTPTARVNAVDREYTLELLIKQGMTRLAEIYVNECWTADIKSLLRHNGKLLEKPNAHRVRLASSLGTNKYQLGMIQFSDDTYHKAGDGILEVLKLCSWNKFYKYIKKQYVFRPGQKKRNYLIDFLDYRQHNATFGLPDFPKNLYQAKEVLRQKQDKIKAVETKKKYKKYNTEIKKRAKQLFQVQDDRFVVFPAPSAESLVDEGTSLRHCVANYTERYAEGKVDLYFLRHKSSSDTPLVTVEIVDGTLRQARGKHNADAPEDVKVLIRKLVNMYKEAQTC